MGVLDPLMSGAGWDLVDRCFDRGIRDGNPGGTEQRGAVMEMKRLTPVLYVEEIEPVLNFWKRLGFEVTA
jgi:hypothetical protein